MHSEKVLQLQLSPTWTWVTFSAEVLKRRDLVLAVMLRLREHKSHYEDFQ